jgi:hypothetical protein
MAVVALLCPVSIGAEGGGSTTIQQLSPKDIGGWALLYPGGVLKSGDVSVNPLNQTVRPGSGANVLSVRPPEGADTRISVYKNGTLTELVNSIQYNFEQDGSTDFLFIIQYSFGKQSTMGITSSPNGVTFRMKGPGGITLRGKTPATFKNLRIGRYTIYMNKIAGCAVPAPQNKVVKDDERVVVHIDMPCSTGNATTDAKPLISRRSLIRSVSDGNANRSARYARPTRGYQSENQ